MARGVGAMRRQRRQGRAVLCAAAALALVVLAPSRAEARGCREVSDIVGEEKCTRYGGKWALEQEFGVSFDFGMRYSEISTSGSNFTEVNDKKGRPAGYQTFRYPGEALGVKSLSALGAAGGISLFLYHQLYMRFEGSLAFGSVSTASFTASNGVKLFKDDGLDVTMFQAGIIPVGYRIPLGRAALRGEVLTGFVQTQVDHRTEAAGLPSAVSASETRILIEPRLAGDIWFTQHISFGVYGGVNILDTDGRGRAFGITLAWHNRSFDGDTSF